MLDADLLSCRYLRRRPVAAVAAGVCADRPVRVFANMTLHRPVMLVESLAGLAVRAGGIYMDATFGRGGHSGAILGELGGSGMLHALDRDPEACEAARRAFGGRPNFRIHHRNFAELGAVCAEAGIVGRVDGIVMDLGVSSPQLDDAARGFSFGKDGPLDMRMNPGEGLSAAEWIAHAKEAEIADVLYRYGDERASRRIARRIVEARGEAPITRTAQLAEIIARAMPGPRQKIHPATRSFQAIRIFINGELDALPSALAQAVEVLAPGGRLAVISFHSLEDRLVKRFMRDAATAQGDDPGLPLPPSSAVPPRLKVLGRIFPAEAESRDNVRARSAVLRVAERLPEPRA